MSTTSIYTCLFSLIASYHFSLSQEVSAFFCLSQNSRQKQQQPEQTFSEVVSTFMEQDWDLYAVVRGCSTITSTNTTTTTTSSASSSSFATCYNPAASSSCCFFSILPSENQPCQSFSISNPFEAKSSSIEELHELCKPFFLKSQPAPSSSSFQTSSPLSSFSYSSSSPKSFLTKHKQQPHHHAGSATTPRSKRRKNQIKKVCQVAAENLSSDIWSWRKYGQKPIKGSPYPRGYYRCSSSKGCLARKQVERNRSEPTMFMVTYNGEHNHPAPTHRNSLAGSTRQKPLTPQTGTGEESDKVCVKTASPETSGAEEDVEFAAQSATKSESKENMEDLMNDEEENEFGLPDMVLSDDFFEGLDELTGSIAAPTGVCFGDPFPASVSSYLSGQ